MTDIANFLNQLSSEQPKSIPHVYSKKILSNDIIHKLLEYQRPHVLNIINILLNKHVALDASDTGIGKTYMTIAICKELDRRPIIISPKTIMGNWMNVCQYFEIEPYDIINYETAIHGKTYRSYNFVSRKKSPYLRVIKPDPNVDNPNPMFMYEWKDIPKDAIVIFDEGHRCKNSSTSNGKLLISAKQLIYKKIPLMILSATICDKYLDMKIPFYLFGIIPSPKNFSSYLRTTRSIYPEYAVYRTDYKTKEEYLTAVSNCNSMIINKEIKKFVGRIRIKDLGDRFPSNQWCAQQFIAEESDKISEAYAEIAILMEELKKNPGANHLARIQKLKQEIELRKVPIFIEQAQLFLEEGKSVIIFVNYLDTLNILIESLGIKCIVSGGQTLNERNEAIDLFQTNKERIIICQMRAGSVGISLHDIHGGHPRAVLINYPDSAADLLQALGRAPRSGAKTPVLQRIIFVANVPYEKRIMQNINRKLSNLSAINDGDLDGYKYKVRRRKIKD